MISDDERREVAQKLRERTKKPMGKSMQRMFTETLDIYAHNLCWRNPDKATNRWDVIVNYLADLIDRPTCEYVPIGDGRFGCSWCGYVKLDYDVLIADEIHIPFNYCPNCSAEVVEDVIFVSALDSPNSPSSNAEGCYSYEKGSRNGRGKA